MKDKQARSPIVVVLGHVDHGKTTLLDYIRKTNIAGAEEGQITQCIGAYEVDTKIKGYENKKITFIDTPGHEAFTQLRLRGANVADIAILIIDAVDSVMPQTVESIYHIKNAKIPFIVAINKVDLKRAMIDKVNKDLQKKDVLVENMGGKIPVVEISAKEGKGINDLLEGILLIASDSNLFYNPNNPLEAYIIETNIMQSGVCAACVIKDGMLSVGDEVYAGENRAKIKALINDKGVQVPKVLPSSPFVLLGFKEIPEVGINLKSKSENLKKEKEKDNKSQEEDFFKQKKESVLKIIVKTDNQGSLDAVLGALSKNKDIKIELSGVGNITKSDIFLAKVAGAIIISFGIGISKDVENIAKQEKVLIKTYSIIYELIDELKGAAELIIKREKDKTLLGKAKIIATFIIDDQNIAGISVVKGKIKLNAKIELFRNEKPISKAQIDSIKQRAKTVKEIKKGDEAGILFEPQLDFRVGDVIKSYSI